MSHQERTWIETVDDATGRPRWNVLINGAPVPGGYIVQVDAGAYEVHYPHIVPFTRATLAEAKERVEWAPPITSGVARIADEVDNDPKGFLDPDAAAERLGVSVYRVNAMVANGKLAARRLPDGTPEVSASSLETLLASRKA